MDFMLLKMELIQVYHKKEGYTTIINVTRE